MMNCDSKRLLYISFFVLAFVILVTTVGIPEEGFDVVRSFKALVVEKDVQKSLLRVRQLEKKEKASSSGTLSYFLSDSYMNMLNSVHVGDYVEITDKTTKNKKLGITTRSRTELLSVRRTAE